MSAPDRGPATWPDGSPRSRNNEFTSHGYVPGKRVEPVQPIKTRAHEPSPRSRTAFGTIGGQIPGMGRRT